MDENKQKKKNIAKELYDHLQTESLCHSQPAFYGNSFRKIINNSSFM